MQPIVVRLTNNNQYEIIAGERRWRAAQIAGIHEVPAVIREMNDQMVQEAALIEKYTTRKLKCS